MQGMFEVEVEGHAGSCGHWHCYIDNSCKKAAKYVLLRLRRPLQLHVMMILRNPRILINPVTYSPPI